MTNRKIRFDLFSLLEWTTALAVIFAVIAGAREMRSVTWRFAALPSDDAALREWLADARQTNITVERTGSEVTLSKGGLAINGPLVFAKPPWATLGYNSPAVHSASNGWTIFGGSFYPWLGIAVVLAAAHIFRRRFVPRPRTGWNSNGAEA